jgi:hypothetical protein
MPSRYEEEDLSRIKPISIEDRKSKVDISSFVDPDEVMSGSGGTGDIVAAMMPDILAGSAIKQFASALIEARDEGRTILWLTGAHVIKCGLSLYLRSLMKKGFVSALACTGSSAIHDIELSFHGATSEDVGEELPRGRFGMARETAEHFRDAVAMAVKEGTGLGEGIGRYIEVQGAPNAGYSVFAGAHSCSVPVTVHVALGTDIVHQHPFFPGEAVGELSMKDFRILCRVVGDVFSGGVVVVFGSAVILPEVFLKAVSIGYNLGKKPNGVTVAAFDMMDHYRVNENILRRPFPRGAKSYRFTGHHEIMMPLLFALLSGVR